MWIGLDVHKCSVYITEMKEDGNISEQYEIENKDESWNVFRDRYLEVRPEIALEVSTTGKYVARLLRDMGMKAHIADPVKLSLIFNTTKKNDKEDSYKLAKLLRLGELPEVHLPSRESDDLRSLVRYRKSIGEEITVIKNRTHALLSRYGITVEASDIFGRGGIREIEKRSEKLSESDRYILSDMLLRVSNLKDRASMIEDEISRKCENNKDVSLLMTIPGINVYSAAAIISEIDDISRFSSKEKLASYAGLVPRQDQSGNRDIRGHITKHGPSMLRFILVNAAHTSIKYSLKMKKKYLSIVRRLGKNRSIVAIARILLEIIYKMLSSGHEFIDNIDSLTERKMKAMSLRAKNPLRVQQLETAIKLLRGKRLRSTSKELFS